MKTKIGFALIYLIAFCSTQAQYFDGSGVFPIDTILTFEEAHSEFIVLAENSIWARTTAGKEGLTNHDSSWSLLTDTASTNVREGDHYFDLRIPNTMLVGDTNDFPWYDDHFPNSTFYSVWNYYLGFKHQFNINGDNFATVLFKEQDENDFDTLANTSNGAFAFYERCEEFNINQCNGIWSHDVHQFTGVDNQEWFYTAFHFQEFPVKKKHTQKIDNDFLKDTTTFRFAFHAAASDAGGPGWAINQLKVLTYICTENCPTSITAQANDDRLKIHPNPVGSTMHVSLDEIASKAGAIKILDTRGQVLQTARLENRDEYTLEVLTLKSGIYLLLIADGEKVYTKRFVKL